MAPITVEKKHRFFINIVKGVAIFLMLWGHCIQYGVVSTNLDFFENSVFKIIYAFHMPLFMLVSGYLFFFSFSKRNLKELLVHRVQSLAWPIVFCTLFNFIVSDVVFGFLNGEHGLIISGKWINSLSSLWFLWSVLTSSSLLLWYAKNSKKFLPNS